MGFWGGLGKIAAGVAAPFTGGASLAAIPAIDALGKVAGGAAKGSADQRLTEYDRVLKRSELESQHARDAALFGQTSARDEFDAGMKGAQFGASEQQRGMRNALLAQMVGGLQDAEVSGLSSRVPKVSIQGGLRPSVLDAGGPVGMPGLLGRIGAGHGLKPAVVGKELGLDAGAMPTLSPRAALMAQLSAPTWRAPFFTPAGTYKAPTLPPMTKAGKMEKILGGVGLAGSLLGAVLPRGDRDDNGGTF